MNQDAVYSNKFRVVIGPSDAFMLFDFNMPVVDNDGGVSGSAPTTVAKIVMPSSMVIEIRDVLDDIIKRLEKQSQNDVEREADSQTMNA